MNEICFVWGPPLSGQVRWMSRAADEATEGVHVTLLPLENFNQKDELSQQLTRLEEKRPHSPPGMQHHVYCELPWDLVYDDMMVEDWLAQHSDLFALGADDPKAWNLSFIAICSLDADRLPEVYRRGMEEFARASHSSVIVVSPEKSPVVPSWLGSESLDFGPRLEVFEENIWPAEPLRKFFPASLESVEEFDTITLPLDGERDFYLSLLDDMATGQHGPIWGAEIFWRNERGEFEALTLTQGKVYGWKSEEPSLIAACSANGACLNVAGAPLRRDVLMTNLRSQKFC